MPQSKSDLHESLWEFCVFCRETAVWIGWADTSNGIWGWNVYSWMSWPDHEKVARNSIEEKYVHLTGEIEVEIDWRAEWPGAVFKKHKGQDQGFGQKSGKRSDVQDNRQTIWESFESALLISFIWTRLKIGRGCWVSPTIISEKSSSFTISRRNRHSSLIDMHCHPRKMMAWLTTRRMVFIS